MTGMRTLDNKEMAEVSGGWFWFFLASVAASLVANYIKNRRVEVSYSHTWNDPFKVRRTR